MFVQAAHPETDSSIQIDIESLHAAHFDLVYAYASRRLSREDAQDATAAVFQAALQGLAKQRVEDPRLWLLGIARRKVADALRRNARRREDRLDETTPGPEDRSLERKETDAQLRRIVMGLPKDQRDALLLQHLESLSISEIATVMGRTPASVNSLLQRARERVLREGRSYFLEPEVNP